MQKTQIWGGKQNMPLILIQKSISFKQIAKRKPGDYPTIRMQKFSEANRSLANRLNNEITEKTQSQNVAEKCYFC